VSPDAGMDAAKKRRTSYPCWDSNPVSLGCSQSLYRLSYPRFHEEKSKWLPKIEYTLTVQSSVEISRLNKLIFYCIIMGK
jgi:hypothetical protein